MARRPVDEKIVKLSMDNRDLAKKASDSVSVLDRLRNGLNKIPGINLGKTTQEVGRLGEVVKGVDYAYMHQGIDMLTNRFSTLGIVGQEVIRRLTNAGIDMVTNLGKAAWRQAMTAGKRRATNIEQAAFQFKGLGIDVEKAMAAAEYATTGTTFGLDEAAVAASQLGASGIEAGDDMATALRAISGVAAMTNSEYSDTAHIFTTVAGNGRLMTDQMRQLATRGLNVAAILADSFGISEQALREMVSAGKVSFEDFYTAMDEAFGEHATSNRETFMGALAAMKASVTRIGATIWTPILEHGRPALLSIMEFINAIHAAFRPIMAEIEPMMKSAFEGFRSFLDNIDFTNLAPTMMALFKSIVNIGTAISRVVTPLINAVSQLFSFEGSPILNLAEGLERLTSKLIISEEASKRLGDIFSNLSGFIKGLIGGFLELIGVVDVSSISISGVFQSFSLGTATALSNMGSWLSTLLSNSAFEGLRKLGEHIGSLTTIFNHHYSETESVFKSIYEVVKEYLRFLNINFESFSDFVLSVVDVIKRVVEPVWELVKDIFSGLEFRHFLGGGFLMGVWGIAKKLIENMDGLAGVWKGITDFIETMKDNKDKSSFLKGITSSLTDFSESLKSSISVGNIVAVATAIGILAASMKILEDLDTQQVTRGMAAIAGSMVALSWGMKALDGVSIEGVGSVKVIAFAAAVKIMTSTMNDISMLDTSGLVKGASGLAAATGILTVAFRVLDGTKIGTGPITIIAMAGAIKILVSTLADIDAVRVEGLIKGLGSIGILLTEIAVFSKVMDGVRVRPGTALSIAGIAGTILIFTEAIRRLDGIRVEGLIKGLGSIGVILVELAVFTTVMNGVRIRPSSTIAIAGIAASMHIFADAIKKIDGVRVEGLIKGLGAIAVILTEIAVFSHFTIGTNMVGTAAGVALIAGAIAILTPPLLEMGEVRWQNLVKGLGALGGALAAITIASNIATGTMGGAIAITILAFALEQLINPITAMSNVSWLELINDILKLGVALGVVAGASVLLSPAIGPMLGFSAALVGFGAAITLIGGGLSLFATGLTTLAGLTAVSVASIITALELLLDGILGILGKVGELISGVIKIASNVIQESSGAIVDAVLEIAVAILSGFEERLDQFIDIGAGIILKIMEGIEEYAEPLANQAADTAIALMDALAGVLDERSPELIESIKGFVGELLIFLVEAGVELVSILFGWIPGVEGAVSNMGEQMTAAIRETFGLDEEVDKNIQRGGDNIDRATPGFRSKNAHMGKTSATEFQRQYIIDKVGKDKGQELIKAIESGELGVTRAGAGLGRSGRRGASSVDWSPAGISLVGGLQRGINTGGGIGGRIWNAARNLASTALSAIRRVFDSRSPSRETTKDGEFFGMGLANGIANMVGRVNKEASILGQQALESTNSFLDGLMSDMDTEMHVRVVLDTSELDNWDPEDFDPVRPGARYTNRLMSEAQPRINQNEDRFSREDNYGTKQTNEYHYDVHIHATGELPRSTIRKMAYEFKEEVENIDRRNRINRGEEVVF